jgi:hypothetical protein
VLSADNLNIFMCWMFEIWEPKPLGTVWGWIGLYRMIYVPRMFRITILWNVSKFLPDFTKLDPRKEPMLTVLIAECPVTVRASYKDTSRSNAKTDLDNLSTSILRHKTQVKQCKTQHKIQIFDRKGMKRRLLGASCMVEIHTSAHNPKTLNRPRPVN